MTRSVSRLAILNYIDSAHAPRLTTMLHDDGFNVVRLDGSSVDGREALMHQATAQLPGFDEVRPHNWASFEDALASLFFEFDPANVALVWTDAHVMVQADLASFMVAADVFLTHARRGLEHDVNFKVIYAGTGPSFPALVG